MQFLEYPKQKEIRILNCEHGPFSLEEWKPVLISQSNWEFD